MPIQPTQQDLNEAAEFAERLGYLTPGSDSYNETLRSLLTNFIARHEPWPTPHVSLLPIVADMPPVPEGCVRVFACVAECMGRHVSEQQRQDDTHYCDIYFPELPPQPDPLEQERKAFEEWMKTQGFKFRDFRRTDDEQAYYYHETQIRWKAWQASAIRPYGPNPKQSYDHNRKLQDEPTTNH